jgi:hypothetical protein
VVEFEWDAGKAASSKLSKHVIGFVEAMTVFNDALEVTIPDPLHSEAESRSSVSVCPEQAACWWSETV